MALWGTKDTGIGTAGPAAAGYASSISLNYATKVITGAGTSFGTVGAAKTGDIIEIGSRAAGATYFGSATIVAIGGTTSITIGSTAGLSGDAIADVHLYKVRESLTYSEGDSSFSTRSDADPSLNTTGHVNVPAEIQTMDVQGYGVSVLPFSYDEINAQKGLDVRVGDYWDSTEGKRYIGAVNEGSFTALHAVAVGETCVRVAITSLGVEHGQGLKDQNASIVGFGSTTATALVGQGATTNYYTIGNLSAHNIMAGDTILTPVIDTAVAIGTVNAGLNTISLVAGASGGTVTAGMAITFFSSNIITLDKGVDVAVVVGEGVTVVGDREKTSFITLTGSGNTVPSVVNAGTAATFKRYQGGYDRHIYGVSGAGLTFTESTTQGDKFVTGPGWVGVTTYTDAQGNLRVKTETLVAIGGTIPAAGITTADTPIYPAYPPNPPASDDSAD